MLGETGKCLTGSIVPVTLLAIGLACLL